MNKKQNYVTVAVALMAVIAGAALVRRLRRTIPKDLNAVSNFNKEKYLGKWYEIARLDYFFEKHLDHTTAEYFADNGSIKVVNRGHDYKSGKQKESVGKAKFIGDESVAKLKVSFFGPFYAGYNVIAVDDDYKYALVAGKNLDYMWLLSREKTMPDDVKEKYLQIAKEAGYNINDLVWVNQN